MGVVCFKFNMHNISNVSKAFIEQTMPPCMHNMPTFMSYINMHLQYPIMHAQYIIIIQAQHTNMHTQYTNSRYVCATCRYACMHNMHASSSHCPKDQSEWMSPQGDFPPSHAFEKDFEVAEKLYRLETNMMGEPLPACQGPWGTLHQISRLYAQVHWGIAVHMHGLCTETD